MSESVLYRSKVLLRYQLLRLKGATAAQADRAARSLARSRSLLIELGGDPDAHPAAFERHLPGRPGSTNPYAVARSARRRRLRELGFTPDRADWYAQRRLEFDKLMATLESPCTG